MYQPPGCSEKNRVSILWYTIKDTKPEKIMRNHKTNPKWGDILQSFKKYLVKQNKKTQSVL